MKTQIEIIRLASYDVDLARVVRPGCGIEYLRAEGYPRPARFVLNGIAFISETPMNAGDAETINRVLTGLLPLSP